MGVKLFVYVVLGFSIIALFANKSVDFSKYYSSQKAFIIFEEPIMYTINEDRIPRVIKAKKVERFHDKDVMNDATIVFVNEESNSLKPHIITANRVVSKGAFFRFYDNVKYSQGDSISFNTNELVYNSVSKVAFNETTFYANYFGNSIKGDSLYYDSKESTFEAYNTHFEILTKDR